jgi:hypothetical protein
VGEEVRARRGEEEKGKKGEKEKGRKGEGEKGRCLNLLIFVVIAVNNIYENI